MSAAAVVMIVAVLLIVLALVYYLVSTIVALRQITAGLDEAIAGVGEIIEKSAPVNDVVTAINGQLDAGVDLLEGLLVKKAGLRDAMGLIEGLYPGAAAAGLRNFPESTEIEAPRIGEVYTRARSRWRGSVARRRSPPPARRARCCATSRAAAWRRACSIPRCATRAPRTCRTRRSSALTHRTSTNSATTSERRASGSRRGAVEARRPGFADPGAIRVRAGHQRRRGDRRARAPRRRRADHRRRPQPAADDEAAPASPEHLVDINDLEELRYIREADGELRIGALTRHVDLLESDLVANHFPVFRDAEQVIADPVVRNRGTIGGSLCQADAAEDLSAVCSAVKAQVVIRGPGGERIVSMEDFHVGPFTTAVGDGELLTEVRVPLRPGAGSAHEKVERRAGDWAIAAASAALWLEGRTIADAGIALSAVGITTIHLTRAEELLRGKPASDDLFAQRGRSRPRTARRRPTARADRREAPPRRGPDAARAAAGRCANGREPGGRACKSRSPSTASR